MELSAEQFLREKLETEISSFGDGKTEFHTREIQHLLLCLDEKDNKIKELERNINYNSDIEKRFKELYSDCMNIKLNPVSLLSYIRCHYQNVLKDK